MVCARVGKGVCGWVYYSQCIQYIFYIVHTGLTHEYGISSQMYLAHCGILDGIQISVGRCGCAFWLHFISFIFILVFIFLSLPFRFYSLLVVGGEKVLLLQWQKRYENAFSDFAQLQLAFLHSFFLFQPEFFLGWIALFFFSFFLHFNKNTQQ